MVEHGSVPLSIYDNGISLLIFKNGHYTICTIDCLGEDCSEYYLAAT